MSVRETLRKSPEEWNHPRWPRVGVPASAAVGAIVAAIASQAMGFNAAIGSGVGAALAVLLAWLVFAALD